jgi:hypothetical protein
LTAGVALGAAAAFVFAVIPLAGLVVAALFAVWALRLRPQLWALAGVLAGTGGMWLLLLWRAASACQPVVTPGYVSDCRPPADLALWTGGGLVFLALGLALLAAALLSSRRREQLGSGGAVSGGPGT